MSLLKRLFFLLAAWSFCLALFAVSSVQALEISNVPLIVKQAVKPNIILGVDDSGSMDSEVLMPSNDGAMWWHTSDQSFVGKNEQDQEESGVLNFNRQGGANSTWKKYVYLFPNGTGDGERNYADSSHDHFAVPPLPQYAFARCSAYNKAYFNPAETYSPWPDLGGHTFGDVDPESAPSDPVLGDSVLDLTSSIKNDANNHTFKMFSGMEIPSGITYNINSGSWQESSDKIEIDNTVDAGIEYFPATFYLPAGSSLPDGYGYVGNELAGEAPDGSNLVGYEIREENFDSQEAYDAAIQNFANWFTYYRKRHAATRGGIGESFQDMDNARVSSFRINSRSNVQMLDLDDAEDRSSFFDGIYSLVGSGGTPSKQAVQHMGEEFMRSNENAPIAYECQQNFGLLFTDGYSNTWWDANVGDVDGDKGEPFADDVSDTMADIAMHYYTTHLREDLPRGEVPVPSQCSAPDPHPSLDCNQDLHMNLFGVTLGTKGQIFGVDQEVTKDPYDNPPDWPSRETLEENRHPSAVDDLWHATLNSRGNLLNAKTPKEISQLLKKVLSEIALSTSSAASVTTNTTRLDTETLVYQAKFNSEGWSGHLLAYSLNMDGSIKELEWDAAEELPTASNREIFTYDNLEGTGHEFTWDKLTDEQKELLIATDSESLGQDRLDYLRGDQSQEQKNGGAFRNRDYLLGDIVNSDPLLVRNEDYGYQALPEHEESSYSQFKSDQADRTPMLYIGANDGMLHAFDATNGQTNSGREEFAFVPASVFHKLVNLTDPNYQHQFYVDGSPRAGDAYIDVGSGKQWRTVLVGSTGAGGQSVFALDITNPGNFDEDDVLWEYSHADDQELGYSIGQPTIARLSDGSWVVLLGNGYGSNSQQASLIILDLASGEKLKTIETEAGSDENSNGLSSPIPGDTNGDRVTDFVYAGDLQGNMWKFDLQSSNQNQWEVAFKKGNTPKPLFIARDQLGNVQPITSRPEVGVNQEGGYMVYFGTGKFFEVGDNNVQDIDEHQSFYGIHDTGEAIESEDRSELQQQEIIYEGEEFGQEIRVTTQSEVNYTEDSDQDDDVKRGWYLDLVSPEHGLQGERVVSPPILRHGRIIFSTLIPSADPCDFGGSTWLMELKAETGDRLAGSSFDLNEDNLFSRDDFVTVTFTSDGQEVEETVPVSGLSLEVGAAKNPAIISSGEKEHKIFSGTSGDLQVVKESPGEEAAIGRQSWRQLR